MQQRCLPPSFETRAKGALLRMRSGGEFSIQISNSVETCIRIPAARSARVLLKFRPRSMSGGRREDRVRAAPAVSCAKCATKSAHEHTGSAENTRPSLRDGLRLITCSSRRTAFLPPSPPGSLLPGNLTPAPRCQNHTPLPSASRALVCRALGVHRIPSQRS